MLNRESGLPSLAVPSTAWVFSLEFEEVKRPLTATALVVRILHDNKIQSFMAECSRRKSLVLRIVHNITRLRK